MTIQYNVPIIQECTEMIGACEVLTAEVHSDAMSMKVRTETHFRGGGGEGFQEDYTRVLTYVEGLREKLNSAKAALGMGLDGVVQKDAAIKAQYGA
ncbi:MULTISPECIES: hypothetical protein [Mycolicibacterium]|uniref:Uncharacterized protein n=2 Tax=Mycolicibacterium TaxID=1866885 RepID=A0AAW5SHY4_MYCNV|nr:MULTISPECIES: hypothetical protein [Mycolicibacterium]EHB45798.1 hypothetical protein MycrhDRAFT_6276 [Mycolicibacterium rhodesiae JS60]MCV7022854.1 hypothetical protein [Mycolicibacterium novocastrense]MDG5486367.1 hypothetical protein [Mycolicibacterium gadium]GAT12998.1 putative uncharacterized protein [Mycolicibacterium novocastrense]